MLSAIPILPLTSGLRQNIPTKPQGLWQGWSRMDRPASLFSVEGLNVVRPNIVERDGEASSINFEQIFSCNWQT